MLPGELLRTQFNGVYEAIVLLFHCFTISLFYSFALRMHNEMKRRIPIAVCLAMTLAFAIALGASDPRGAIASPAPQAFSQLGAPRALKGAAGIYEWHFVAARGPSPFDRIGLHRIANGPAAPPHPEIVMFYLPGTNMNGEIAVDDSRYSMPVYLAVHGVDVWTMDYRTHFVAPDTPAPKLAVMTGWTNRVFDGDIEAAVAFVSAETHNDKLFIAGFSRGASFAYLFAALHPQNVAGLVILDGFIPRRPASAMPAGRVADDIAGRHLTYDKRRALMEAVIRDPGGPAPLPKYKSAAENLEHVVYDADGAFGGHGGLANPQGGFSDPSVLARVLIGYDRWWPAVQDFDNPFDANVLARLKASKIPVIAFASTNISAQWQAMVAESAAATGSADVTVKRLVGWGHLDVICGTHAEGDVYAPVLAWLRRRQK
jgi:pimeloyl-ACP methyl ester carboxylesterase